MELEGGAALAALRRDDADLAAMADSLARLGGTSKTRSRASKTTSRSTWPWPPPRNSHYADLLRYLNLQLRQAVGAARANSRQQAGLSVAVHQEHVAVFEAIRAQDAAAARCGRGAPSANRRAIAAGAGGGRAVAHRCPVIDPIRF